jgi:cell shape-determining protein MreC
MKVRSRHNSKRYRTYRVAFIALAVVFLGILLPRAMSAIATVLMTPVHSTNQWLEESSSLVPTFFRDRRFLQTQIEDLENRLLVSERSSLTQDRLWEENNHLRSLLGAAGEERIAAAVVARPHELPYDLLQIDRGSDHGIELGAPVFMGKDLVIGLVVHVAPEYSFVELFTTAGFEVSTFIAGPNIVVTMEGMGGGVARVRVPQGIPLAVGNLVYLPSINPGVFGRINYVENQPTQPEQYGYISPDLSLGGLYYVVVGTQSQIARSTAEIDVQAKVLLEKSLLSSSSPMMVSATTSTTTNGAESL